MNVNALWSQYDDYYSKWEENGCNECSQYSTKAIQNMNFNQLDCH